MIESIRGVADQLGLSAQDVIRQSTKLGMPLLVERLSAGTDKPARLSLGEALRWGKLKGDLRIERISGAVVPVKL